MPNKRGIFTIVVVVLLVSTGTLAFAATAKAQTLGTVDVEKAFNEYNKKVELDNKLMGFAQELDGKLKLRETNRLLTKDEFSQLQSLVFKASPTDDDRKKADELSKLSVDREKEYQTLQQKQSPTDEEKSRLKQLQEIADLSAAALKEDRATFGEQFNDQRVEMSRQVMSDIETTIAAVAKEKGLSIVFNKSVGEVSLIVYSSADITGDVLKKLNKK